MTKYTVQMISNTCNISPHTLRAWEKRYQVVSPGRSEGGQRLYSQSDLERIQYLKRLVEQGHKISLLAKESTESLKNMLDHQDKEQPIGHGRRVEELLESLRQYDLKGLRQKLESHKLDHSIRGYIFSIVLPLFERVGNLVEQKKLSISQEHALSAIVRSSLLQINPPLLYPIPNRVIALATPEGNLHELGIIMANILANANQWESLYFGPNLPAHALADSVSALSIPYVLLGGLYEGNAHLFKEYLLELDKKCRCIVILGGNSKNTKFDGFKNISVEIKPNFLALEEFLRGN